jgi:hypothetical protein
MAPADPAPAGNLAYIGRDGNVYVTDATLKTKIAVTNDATAFPEGSGRSYHRVSWSRGGQLAFASVTRAVMTATSEIFVVDSPQAPPRRIVENDQNFVIYLYWSPAACPNSLQCEQLVYLIEEADDQIGLYLTRLQADTVSNTRLGAGRPLYLAWHPDGERMVWHTGGSRRFNANAKLQEYHVTRQTTTLLDLVPGLFYAPAWSPRGDNWLGVLANGSLDQLHLIDAGQKQSVAQLAEVEDNQVTFTWSPDGNQIAYATRKSVNDPLYNPIQVN